jgi:hypothetical protein
MITIERAAIWIFRAVVATARWSGLGLGLVAPPLLVLSGIASARGGPSPPGLAIPGVPAPPALTQPSFIPPPPPPRGFAPNGLQPYLLATPPSTLTPADRSLANIYLQNLKQNEQSFDQQARFDQLGLRGQRARQNNLIELDRIYRLLGQ